MTIARQGHSFVSAFVPPLLVLDPLGCLPIFISVMGDVEPQRRTRIAVREVFIAFAVLTAFMFSGQGFLNLMHLLERSLEVAGGAHDLIPRLPLQAGEGAWTARFDRFHPSSMPCAPRIAIERPSGSRAASTRR